MIGVLATSCWFSRFSFHPLPDLRCFFLIDVKNQMLMDRLRDLALDLAAGCVIGSRPVGSESQTYATIPRFWATAVRVKIWPSTGTSSWLVCRSHPSSSIKSLLKSKALSCSRIRVVSSMVR